MVLSGLSTYRFLKHLPPNLGILVFDGLICEPIFLEQLELRVFDLYARKDSFHNYTRRIEYEINKSTKHILDYDYDYDYSLLDKLPNLKHLKIKFELDVFTFSFDYEYFSRLESLSLEFPYSWQTRDVDPLDMSPFSNLKYLELHSRSDSVIFDLVQPVADLIGPLKSLEELHLVNLKLKNSSLEGAFCNSKMLKKLNMDKNQLSKIDSATFEGLENLSELSLRHNCLDFIEPKTYLDVFPKLDRLVLSSMSPERKDDYMAYFESRSKVLLIF